MTAVFAIAAGALLVTTTIYAGARIMSAATDRLTASVQAATASVDALIARIPPPAPPVDETPIIAAADALDALKAKVDAVNPEPPKS